MSGKGRFIFAAWQLGGSAVGAGVGVLFAVMASFSEWVEAPTWFACFLAGMSLGSQIGIRHEDQYERRRLGLPRRGAS